MIPQPPRRCQARQRDSGQNIPPRFVRIVCTRSRKQVLSRWARSSNTVHHSKLGACATCLESQGSNTSAKTPCLRKVRGPCWLDGMRERNPSVDMPAHRRNRVPRAQQAGKGNVSEGGVHQQSEGVQESVTVWRGRCRGGVPKRQPGLQNSPAVLAWAAASARKSFRFCSLQLFRF